MVRQEEPMKRVKQLKLKSEIVSNGYVGWTWNQHRFFMGCRNRAAVSDLIVTVAAGKQVTAANVPVDLLPCVLFLQAVAPEPGIVDDTLLITSMMEEEYTAKDHGARFWHPEGFLAARMTMGLLDPDRLLEIPDAGYIYKVYEELTNGKKREDLFSWLPKEARIKASTTQSATNGYATGREEDTCEEVTIKPSRSRSAALERRKPQRRVGKKRR